MRRIAIKTAGLNGKNLYSMFIENECYKDIQVVCFADNNTSLINSKYKDIPIVSDFALAKMYLEKKVDNVVIPCELFKINYTVAFTIQEIYHQLQSLGISRTDIKVSNILYKQSENGDCRGFDKDFVDYDNFCHLRYLEYPIAYHCNLNCKGCSHFSPLVEKEFTEFEKFEKDFIKLEEFIPHIGVIRILGGEPLLNSEVDRYIRLTRRLYKYSNIVLVTNGILVKNMPDSLLDCIKENDVSVEISVYPPLHKTIDSILAFLQKNNIKITMGNSCEFMPTFSAKRSRYPYMNLERTCRYYYFADGYLSACMLMHDIKFYNEYFNENLSGEDGLINVYDKDMTQELMMKKLRTPLELCDHCAMYKHMASDLSFLNHEDVNIGWGHYSKSDRPVKADWYEREV